MSFISTILFSKIDEIKAPQIRNIFLGFISFALCEFNAYQVSAQTILLDSLRIDILAMPDDTAKADSLHQLFNMTIDRDDAMAIKDAQTGMRLANRLNSQVYRAMFFTDLAHVNLLRGETAESRALYKKALREIAGRETSDYPITTFTHLANYFMQTGQLDSASYYLDRANQLLARASPAAKLFQLKKLSWFYYQNSQYSLAIESGKSRIKLNSTDDDAFALLFKCFLRLELYDSAKLMLDNAFYFNANKIDSLSSRSYVALVINRGDLHMEISDYKKSLLNYEVAYLATSKHKFNLLHAYTSYRMGHYFEISGNYPKAIELYNNSIDIYSQYEARQQIAQTNGRIAWSLIYSNNTILAAQYAHRSLDAMKKVPDKTGASYAWNLLGYLNYLSGNYSVALQFYDSALQTRKTLDRQADYYKTLSNIAEVHEQLGELDIAADYLSTILAQEEENSKDIFNLIFTYYTVGRVQEKLGNQRQAEKNYKSAYSYSKENRLYPQLKTSLIYLLDFYRSTENAREVLKYYNELKLVNDTLAALELNNRILQVSALRELEFNQKELEELKLQASLDALNVAKSNQALTFYFYLVTLLVIVLISLGYILYARKQNQKQLHEANKELEKMVLSRTKQLRLAYEELETYFYKASHDLRGPITSLLGLVDLLKTSKKQDEQRKINELIEVTAIKQMHLVNKIQSLNSVLKADVIDQRIPIKKEISSILEKYDHKIVAKGIRVTTNIHVDFVHSTPELFNPILDNLINNAVDFSNNPNPVISINIGKENGHIFFSVVDNGEGIHQEISSDLYKMFFRGSVRSSGFGLGLYTVKKAAEKLGATISFDSEPHKRTEFKLILKREVI